MSDEKEITAEDIMYCIAAGAFNRDMAVRLISILKAEGRLQIYDEAAEGLKGAMQRVQDPDVRRSIDKIYVFMIYEKRYCLFKDKYPEMCSRNITAGDLVNFCLNAAVDNDVMEYTDLVIKAGDEDKLKRLAGMALQFFPPDDDPYWYTEQDEKYRNTYNVIKSLKYIIKHIEENPDYRLKKLIGI